MSTNYYFHQKPPCECCGRPYERLHIGKSSAGWCFALHVIPEEGIHDLGDWLTLGGTPGTRIEDEYGRRMYLPEMHSVVADRSWDRDFDKEPVQSEYAEPGPNGLLRHKIRPGFCIGHGAGTWDLIVGEFS